MDSKRSLLNSISKVIPFINDDFLISIANKGIVNRSKKDLDKLEDSIKLSVDENGIINGVIENDINVTINENIQKSVCSCPSSTICKHIIMVLMYCKKYYDDNSSEIGDFECENEQSENTVEEQPYLELNSITTEQALELIGKTEYNSLVHSINIKPEAQFEYGDLLTVTISSQNVKVFFPKNNSIKNVACSCKEKSLCRHKSYAIISYMIQERKMALEAEDDDLKIGKAEEELLITIKDYVSKILEMGMTGVTENEIANIERLYKRSYGFKFFRMASELKALSNEISLYSTKNVSFSLQKTIHIICSVYNRCQAILKNRNDDTKKVYLAGKRKEDSFVIDNISFIGLGAMCRVTQRNDILLNSYFYCNELKSIHILSTMRPAQSSNSEYLYNAGLLWSDEYSIRVISSSKIILKDAKVSEGRLSNTKSTVCQIKGKSGKSDFDSIAVNDFNELKRKLKKQSFKYFSLSPEAESIFLLKVSKTDGVRFDKIDQKLYFNAYDSLGNIITFEIKYNQASDYAIKFLENEKNPHFFEYILGYVKEKSDLLMGTFLSGADKDGIKNIFFKER